MAVPVVVAARKSPSPAKVPPAIRTVALASVTLSASDMVTLGAKVAAPAPWVKDALAGTPDSAGGLLTAVMLSVVVCAALRLFDAPPSSSTQLRVRLGLEP